VAFSFFCVFFFQAEDGIRDTSVTGVQTCALPICEDQLLGPAGESDGERTLRLREGRLHGSANDQAGEVRAGGYGNGISGRDRRRAGGDSGEAAAGFAGARVRAPGEQCDAAHRYTPGGGDQPGSARGAGAGDVSRGPLLPAERGAAEHSAVARTQGGHTDRKSTRLNSSHRCISYAV